MQFIANYLSTALPKVIGMNLVEACEEVASDCGLDGGFPRYLLVSSTSNNGFLDSIPESGRKLMISDILKIPCSSLKSDHIGDIHFEHYGILKINLEEKSDPESIHLLQLILEINA